MLLPLYLDISMFQKGAVQIEPCPIGYCLKGQSRNLDLGALIYVIYNTRTINIKFYLTSMLYSRAQKYRFRALFVISSTANIST